MKDQSAIRQQLHDLVEQSDSKLLNILYAVASEYNAIDDEELSELERRSARRKSGLSKTYNWEEARRIITAKEGL